MIFLILTLEFLQLTYAIYTRVCTRQSDIACSILATDDRPGLILLAVADGHVASEPDDIISAGIG